MLSEFWHERPIIGLLLAFMVLDVISGTLAAFVTRQLSSSVSWAGGAKKALTIIIVTAGYLAESLLDIPAGRLTAMFFAVTEALSILENATRAGIPIPEVLRMSLVKARPAEVKPQVQITLEQRRPAPPGPPEEPA